MGVSGPLQNESNVGHLVVEVGVAAEARHPAGAEEEPGFQ